MKFLRNERLNNYTGMLLIIFGLTFLFLICLWLGNVIVEAYKIEEIDKVMESTESMTLDVSNETLYKTFMIGCTSEGGNEAYCSCGYEYLRSKHSLEDLTTLFKSVRPGDVIPEWALETADRCIHLYEYTQVKTM